jgi:hypothetical protein
MRVTGPLNGFSVTMIRIISQPTSTSSAVWIGNLGCRWSQIGGQTFGGLGGIFKSRVWYPQLGGEDPTYYWRREYVQQVRRSERWKPSIDTDIPELRGMPLGMRCAIFPEDIKKLSAYRLDVIVSHEAPVTKAMRDKGFAALNVLADDTGCKLWLHGHHHKSYSEVVQLASGRTMLVRGLAIGECLNLDLEMPL